MQRIPVRLCFGQRLRELHEPQADRTGCFGTSEREPPRLLHGACRVADHPSARARQAVGGGVPQALRHIENLLRQAPQRRVRPRRHRRKQEIPQGHRQGRRKRKTTRFYPVASHHFPIQGITIQL